jgi:DNA-binding winged helix-turn-helix (wHTH) protein
VAETQSRPRLVRFGAFEADVRTGELRKDGVKLKFSGQPFQVLAILLERPGEVVTREELQKRLWPDTFVDVERNLNTAVNKIREVLGDSAESPRYLETLPRPGVSVHWCARSAGSARTCRRTSSPLAPASSVVRDYGRHPRTLSPRPWNGRRLSRVPPPDSTGEQNGNRAIECRPVYGIAGRRDFPRLLSRWIPNRFRVER